MKLTIGDSMLGSLFQLHDIDGVVVGADRIVANGDTANKVRFAPAIQLCEVTDIRSVHIRLQY